MKRIAEEGVDDATKRRLFDDGPEKIISLAELKDILSDATLANKDMDQFLPGVLAFTIEDLNTATTFTVRKHGLGNADCKGRIIDGTCRLCGAYAAGVAAYSFKANIADVSDETNTLAVTCADGAGRSLFGIDAYQFEQLTTSAAKDKIEAIMFVKKKSGCWIKMEAGSSKPLVVIYSIRNLA